LLNFTTTGPPSVVPVITNVAASNLGTTSAVITWNTDVPSTSQVNYGTTPSYGFSSPLDSTVTTTHSVTLTGLLPGTQYDFQVVSAGVGGVSKFGANMAGLTVWAWGDSLTLGFGDYLSQNTYPLYLSVDIGTAVANEGVGGWTSTQIAQLMLSTPSSFGPGNCNIIWSGGNNHNDVNQILTDIASMVAALTPPACYLVIGDINREQAPIGTFDFNNFVATNTSLASIYGNNYLNIREILVQNYNPALPLDVADYNNDVPPASMRAVQLMGTITSGALDSFSCTFTVSNGTQGPGTAVIIDSETILINTIVGNSITGCTRGYNQTAPASHAANSNYFVIDGIHLGDKGYELVATSVAPWFEARFPLNFRTASSGGPAPVISGISVSNLTSTTATILWSTDQPSSSQVNYGITQSYGLSSAPNGTLVTSHSVTITNLTPGTTYNFDVVSQNAGGATGTSANQTFSVPSGNLPSFTLSATAATATPSSPGTSTITVAPVNGFSSVVGFSATGWPAGITGSFATNPSATGSAVSISVNASVGTGIYNLTVTGTSGTLSSTATIVLNVTSPASAGVSATFVALDTSTQGSWSGVYGADGDIIANGENSVPAYASVAFAGDATFTWAGATSDLRALQVTRGSTARLASCFYSTNSRSFTVSLNLSDGATHQIAIYMIDWDTTLRSQTVTITDPATGLSLDSRTISQFSGGVYGVWNIKGNVTITVTALGAVGAVASGIFFGPPGTAPAPTFTLSSTAAAANQGSTGTSTITVNPANGFNGAVTLAPNGWPAGITATFGTNPATASSVATINVAASVATGAYSLTVNGTSGTLSANTNIALTVNAAPQPAFTLGALSATATSGSTGNSTITVTGTGGFNSAVTLSASAWPAGITGSFATNPATTTSAVSLSVHGVSGILSANTAIALTVSPVAGPGSSVAFVGTDALTQGSWSGNYGADGFLIANGARALPAYANVTFAGSSTYTWVASSSDLRALQSSSGSAARIASSYYSPFLGSFNITLNLTDGALHQVALYLVDWDTTTRAQTMTVTDTVTGALLDTRTFSNFHNGQYAVWNIKGNVTINVAATAGNAVVSGLFFAPVGGAPPPSFTLSSTAGAANAGSTGSSTITVNPTNGFNSPVTLAASGWPAGITGTFGTNPATASSSVTISVGSSVAPGLYSLAVNGTSGTLTASTNIPFTVTTASPPSFILGATSSIVSAGSAGTSTVTITPVNGFNSAVTLATSNWPAGITATFNTNPATTSSSVLINVAANVGTGLYSLTVNGTAGALSSSTTIALTVSAATQAANAATFLGLDSTTQGAWIGKYGSAGYLIANGPSVSAGSAAVSVAGSLTYTWVARTTDPRALQLSAGTSSGIASAYTQYPGQSFTVRVTIPGGAVQKLSLYLLDWDSTSRVQTITVLDAATNAVLDTQTFSGFSNGQYASWSVKGDVIFKITGSAYFTPVVSGIFVN
jgi:lysophospholipase L1-like esterase